MATFETAFEEVKKLVIAFKEHDKTFLSPNYSEVRVRDDFIDYFFIALGWDVTHIHEKNPYRQEVKIEKSVADESRRKRRADYAFSLAPNYKNTIFIVEAKKPARDLFNADDYLQSIRYATNTNTPIVVLTDFEEFHIVDARFKTTIDTALRRKIREYHYHDYADKKKFAEIYYLFSHEAVAGNSIQEYADSLSIPTSKAESKTYLPKGTKSVDESLLDELEEIRKVLAKAFKKENSSLDSYALTEATQRTIDRLVFLRFLEDKFLEPDLFVSRYARSKTPWKDFTHDCIRFNAKYNGVVFRKHFIDENSFKSPAAKTFIDVCNRLTNPDYYFDVIPIHILGSIYERFLGSVVHATAKEVTIRQKPEVKKAGGVYYTPEYIVRYIVENTVGKLIEGKSPLQISRMHFADIACGSGSFLISVFGCILDYHSNWYNDNPKKAKNDGCIYIKEDDKWVLSLKQKRKILINNIYGVDIDEQAVEVTELSLYLKLLEDETTATAHEMSSLFTLLPDISNNIICGNSLIDPDILMSDLFIDDSYERKINPLSFDNAFSDVMDKGGFDAIVGNPPYDVLEKERKMDINPHTTLRHYVKNNSEYSPALGGKLNLFRFFVVKMVNLTKLKGKFGFIIPLSILADQSCASSRAFLFDSSKDIIADCFPQKDNPKKRVFKGAKLSTVVITGSHSFGRVKDSEKSMTVRTYPWNKFNDGHKEAKILLNELKLIDPDNLPVPLIDNTEWRLLTKIYKTRNIVTLSNISDFIIRRGEINQTIFREFISENPKHTRLIKGVEIGQYKVNEKLSQGKKEYFHEREYLKVNKEKSFAYGQRIATQRITGVDERLRIVAAIIKPVAYFADSTNSVHKQSNSPYHLFYLLTLLNSKLFQWRFKLTSTNNNVGTNELEALPFRIVNFSNKTEKAAHDKIVQLVDQIIVAKKKLATATSDGDKNYYERRTTSIDREINKEVNKLYGLSKDEIEIINE